MHIEDRSRFVRLDVVYSPVGRGLRKRRFHVAGKSDFVVGDVVVVDERERDIG